MKTLIKNTFGYCKAKLNNVKFQKNLYIGFDVKIVNKGVILMGNNVTIRGGGRIYTCPQSELQIDKESDIGEYSTISVQNFVKIGKNVLTGPHIFIADHNHEYKDINIPIIRQGVKYNQGDSVEIGDGTWLGTNVVIVGNVKIGKNCVIGANSVVTKDIPDYCVAAGAPSKVIRQYNFETEKWEKINKSL